MKRPYFDSSHTAGTGTRDSLTVVWVSDVTGCEDLPGTFVRGVPGVLPDISLLVQIDLSTEEVCIGLVPYSEEKTCDFDVYFFLFRGTFLLQ